MGKAAENEKIKLRAAFYNNMAVGAVVAGALLPLVNFYQKDQTIILFVSHTSWLEIYHYLLPMGLAFCAAGWARSRVKDILEKLQD